MNTEFPDQEMVELLRGAAQVLPGTRAEHVAAAGAAGRRIRRRRRAASAIGAGTAGLVVVAGVTLLGVNAGNGTQTVLQPATEAGPSPTSASSGTSKPALSDMPSMRDEQAEALANEKTNLGVLLKALGPDWRAADDQAGSAQVEPRAGSTAANSLPHGYTARASMMVFNTDGRSDLSLASVCKPFAEKGTVNQGCTVMSAADEKRVYYAGPGPTDGDQAGVPWSSAMYYFGRSDGSLVRIEFVAGSSTQEVGATQKQRAVDWMERYKNALAGAVADDGVMPHALETGSTPTAPMITDHDGDLVRMQQALGKNWTLSDGTLGLEPNWPEYKELPELPHGYWDAPADITTISRSAFDAACGADAGATPCEKRTTKDGSEVYVRTWADRDAASGEYVGESAAYLLREDGSVLLAEVKLHSVQETKVENSDQVAGMRTWLTNLQSRLIKAVTDPDVKG